MIGAFRPGAVLRHFRTPSLRAAGFEDDDEDKNSLPDVAPRFALPPAQSRPCKRGTLHKKNVGEVGRTKCPVWVGLGLGKRSVRGFLFSSDSEIAYSEILDIELIYLELA